MSLRIRFTNKTDYGPAIAFGEITLNDFAETFETPLTFWSAERYERQWREGVERLRLGLSRSCLITSLIEPGPELFGMWWKLYHEGDQILVQNQMLLASEFGNFNPDNPYASIPEHVSVNADGEPVSEWVVRFDAIKVPLE